MPWYQVTKTINGRQYLYLQMTYRQGGRVKTRNKYIGPVHGHPMGGGAPANVPLLPSKSSDTSLRRELAAEQWHERQLAREARAEWSDAHRDGKDVIKQLKGLYRVRRKRPLLKRYLTPEGLKDHYKIRRLHSRLDAVNARLFRAHIKTILHPTQRRRSHAKRDD